MAHEIHEHIEHAGHAGHEGGSILPQLIGITVAILGVVMALCSAQLGAARTELLATMNEANDASAKHQTISTKTLMLLANLQQLIALQPDEKEFKDAEDELKKIEADIKNAEMATLAKAHRLHTAKILTTVTPTDDVLFHFAHVIRVNEKEERAAERWAESYEEVVRVHNSTAEWFERALVCAEIGIVIASVGLLLARKAMLARALWGVALALGLLSMSVAGFTFMKNTAKLHEAEARITDARTAYKDLLAKRTADEDEKMLEELEQKKKAKEKAQEKAH